MKSFFLPALLSFSIHLVIIAFGLTTLWAATAHTIGQKGKQFSQAEITVKVGDTIKFLNDDDVAHNVFTRAPGQEFNHIAKPGETYEVEIKQPGTIVVCCAIHPKMKLIVKAE